MSSIQGGGGGFLGLSSFLLSSSSSFFFLVPNQTPEPTTKSQRAEKEAQKKTQVDHEKKLGYFPTHELPCAHSGTIKLNLKEIAVRWEVFVQIQGDCGNNTFTLLAFFVGLRTGISPEIFLTREAAIRKREEEV